MDGNDNAAEGQGIPSGLISQFAVCSESGTPLFLFKPAANNCA
jgi:hypothetical protein